LKSGQRSEIKKGSDSKKCREQVSKEELRVQKIQRCNYVGRKKRQTKNSGKEENA